MTGKIERAARALVPHGPDPNELAERCEQAAGPDRRLDQLIEETLPGVLPHPDTLRPQYETDDWAYVISSEGHPHYEPGQGYSADRYTASLDAAMTLVGDLDYSSRRDGETCRAVVWIPTRNIGFDGNAATPALALCAASLKARASLLNNGKAAE